jgi:arginine repressor
MDDYISRQDAIKSLLELTTFKTKRELVERIESSVADEN